MNAFFSKIYYINYFRKFKSFGNNISLSKFGKIIRPEEISLGNNIYINSSFHISARNLTFGSDIMIGPNLVIECDNHIYDKIGISMFHNSDARSIGFIKIENDVWIGANVVILPNVIIGEGCIIGAGSIVTKTLPPYSICVGNPCIPIKARFKKNLLIEHINKVQSILSPDFVVNELNKYKINI